MLRTALWTADFESDEEEEEDDDIDEGENDNGPSGEGSGIPDTGPASKNVVAQNKSPPSSEDMANKS